MHETAATAVQALDCGEHHSEAEVVACSAKGSWDLCLSTMGTGASNATQSTVAKAAVVEETEADIGEQAPSSFTPDCRRCESPNFHASGIEGGVRPQTEEAASEPVESKATKDSRRW